MTNNRGLRVFVLIGSTLTLTLPYCVRADAPSPRLIGEIGALGKFCGGLEPGLEASGEKFLHELRQQLAPGAESSGEFRQGYDRMSDALAKLDREKALALCALTPMSGAHGGSLGNKRR